MRASPCTYECRYYFVTRPSCTRRSGQCTVPRRARKLAVPVSTVIASGFSVQRDQYKVKKLDCPERMSIIDRQALPGSVEGSSKVVSGRVTRFIMSVLMIVE